MHSIIWLSWRAVGKRMYCWLPVDTPNTKTQLLSHVPANKRANDSALEEGGRRGRRNVPKEGVGGIIEEVKKGTIPRTAIVLKNDYEGLHREMMYSYNQGLLLDVLYINMQVVAWLTFQHCGIIHAWLLLLRCHSNQGQYSLWRCLDSFLSYFWFLSLVNKTTTLTSNLIRYSSIFKAAL